MTPATMLVRPSRHYRQRGFTILELLVAFAIMAISLGMLYQATGSSVRTVGETERFQRAAMLAESLLALRDSVSAEGWNDSGESAGYVWRVTSSPFASAVADPKVPVLHEVGVQVSWQDGDRVRMIEATTLRPERKPPPGGKAK